MNIPEVKPGITAVSRDCFPIARGIIWVKSLKDIAYNQPKSLPYPTENPWG